jgi:hypothetical protein
MEGFQIAVKNNGRVTDGIIIKRILEMDPGAISSHARREDSTEEQPLQK